MNSSLNISDLQEPTLNVVFQVQLNPLQIKEVIYFMILSEGDAYDFHIDNFNKVVGMVYFAGFPIVDVLPQLEKRYSKKGLLLADSLATETIIAKFPNHLPTIKLGLKNDS